MAVDWSREVSFSGLKKRKKAPKTSYPEKTYMNLAVVPAQEQDTGHNLLLILFMIVLVIAVVKFGIFDFYARVNDKQMELAEQQQTLNVLNEQIKNYDEVLAEYQSYASISISKDGLQVDVLEALSLVDDIVAPSSRIMSITLTGNTLTLNVTDITLDGVGQLVSRLYEQDIVRNVSVSTAATQQTASEDVTAALTITMVPTQEREVA